MPIGAAFQSFFHRASTDQADLFPSAKTLRPPIDGCEQSSVPLFDGGPPAQLQAWAGLMSPGKPNYLFRAFIVVSAGWLPLLILSAAQSFFLRDGGFHSFLTDYGVHARSLIAAPLFLLAEATCLPRLSTIARHFGDAGLIRPSDLEAFRAIRISTLRLRDSTRLEVAVFAFAITLVATLAITVPLQFFPQWHRMGSGPEASLSPAGFWHNFVSVPILMILLLGWLWRLAIWTRFLFLVSRLRLRLVPSHPDRAGGLKFVGISVQAFSFVAFPMAMIVAGAVANRVMHDHAAILSFRYVLLGFDTIVVALFLGPVLVFAGKLMTAWRWGIFEYGALARNVGRQMEKKWIGQAADADALGANDFSATTDLYSIAANAYGMTILPVSLINFIVLLAATMLPFVPVILMSVSPDVLFQKLTGILL